MSPQDARNHSTETEQERPEQEEETSLPWFEEEEIVAREYDEEVPWVEEE